MKNSLILLTMLTYVVNSTQAQTIYDSLDAIVTGSISIYKSNTKYYIEKDGALTILPPSTEQLITRDGKQMLLKTDPYKGVLSFYLSGCPKSVNLIKSLKLTEGELIKLMKSYYKCVNEAPLYTETSSKRIAINIGPVFGYQLSRANINSSNEDFRRSKFDTQTKFLIAGFYEIHLLKSNISFGGQLNVVKYNLEGYSRFNVGGTTIENTLITNYTQYQNKIFIRKYFNTNTINVHLSGGPVLYLNKNFEQNRRKTETINGGSEMEIYNGDFYEPKRSSLGLFAGIGLEKFIVPNKISISFQALYETMNRITDNFSALDINTNQMTFQSAIKYRINRANP